jgi:hypothetical protein
MEAHQRQLLREENLKEAERLKNYKAELEVQEAYRKAQEKREQDYLNMQKAQQAQSHKMHEEFEVKLKEKGKDRVENLEAEYLAKKEQERQRNLQARSQQTSYDP